MSAQNESVNARRAAALILFAAIAVVLSNLVGSWWCSCTPMSSVRAFIRNLAGGSVAAWASILILCVPVWTIAALGAITIALRYKSSWIPHVLVYAIAFPLLAILLPHLVFGPVIRFSLIGFLLELADTPIAVGAAACAVYLTQRGKTCKA